MNGSAPSVLSAREAAAHCGVDERTVRRWIASGRLRAERRRRGFRIAVAALTPFLADAADTPDSDAAAVRTVRTDTADHAAESDSADTGTTDRTDSALLVAHLERENAWLRAQVDAHQQAEAELRRLLAVALQRPALPAPVTVATGEPLPSDGTSSRPWWRRWLVWRR